MATLHDDNCIFCKIVRREAPSVPIYEDDHVVAFMDIAPVTKGHTLVIPKRHYATLDAMPADDMAELGRVLPRLAKAVTSGCNTNDYNIMQNNGKRAGQVVFHVHYHIIPRYPTENKLLGKQTLIPRLKLTKEEFMAMQSNIRAKL